MSGMNSLPAKEGLTLLTERLLLRIMTLRDVTDKYVAGLNDLDINRYLTDVKAQRQNHETVQSFVAINLDSPVDYFFGIFYQPNSHLIGTIRVGGISHFHFFASIGICLLDKNYWGQGYALEALTRIVAFCFDELSLHYLEAGCYRANSPAVTLFTRAGFKLKANFQEKYRFEHGFASVDFFGLVNHRFDPRSLMT